MHSGGLPHPTTSKAGERPSRTARRAHSDSSTPLSAKLNQACTISPERSPWSKDGELGREKAYMPLVTQDLCQAQCMLPSSAVIETGLRI